MHGIFYVVKTLGTEVPDPSGDGGTCPLRPPVHMEKKLTFPMYKNILLDIKDMREK